MSFSENDAFESISFPFETGMETAIVVLLRPFNSSIPFFAYFSIITALNLAPSIAGHINAWLIILWFGGADMIKLIKAKLARTMKLPKLSKLPKLAKKAKKAKLAKPALLGVLGACACMPLVFVLVKTLKKKPAEQKE
jgi:hypothetical protein